MRDPAVRIGDDRRAPGIRLLANVDVERKPAQERHVVIGAHLLAAALSEDRLRVPAIRADMHAHVLDDAHDGHTHLVEHLEPLARIDQRNVLRCGHDHGAGYGHLLRERELDVAGAGRHVDDEVIEVTPVGVLQQLLQRLRHHRAAPDHRRVDVDQKADRHRLQPVRFERLQRLAVPGLGTARDAEHHRLRRSVDVGIEHADLRALRGERQREIDGGGRLADTTLAARDRDDVLDAGHELDATLHRMRRDFLRHVDGDAPRARQRRERVDDQLAQRLVLRLRGIAELDVDDDVGAVDVHLLDGFATHKIFAGDRIGQRAQSRLDIGLGDGHGLRHMI